MCECFFYCCGVSVVCFGFDLMKVVNVRTIEIRIYWIMKMDVEYGGELNIYLCDVIVCCCIVFEIFYC